MDSLDAFKGVADALNGLGLDRYAGRLQAEGWDSIDDLHHLARPSLEAIARGAGMLPGHTFRFVAVSYTHLTLPTKRIV